MHVFILFFSRIRTSRCMWLLDHSMEQSCWEWTWSGRCKTARVSWGFGVVVGTWTTRWIVVQGSTEPKCNVSFSFLLLKLSLSFWILLPLIFRMNAPRLPRPAHRARLLTARRSHASLLSTDNVLRCSFRWRIRLAERSCCWQTAAALATVRNTSENRSVISVVLLYFVPGAEPPLGNADEGSSRSSEQRMPSGASKKKDKADAQEESEDHADACGLAYMDGEKQSLFQTTKLLKLVVSLQQFGVTWTPGGWVVDCFSFGEMTPNSCKPSWSVWNPTLSNRLFAPLL